MNKKTVALSQEDYADIINAIKTGFTYYGADGKQHKFRANTQLATIFQLQAVAGLRIGDLLKLRLVDLVKDGNRRRFDVVEEKTGKKRTFTIPNDVYAFLRDYADDAKIGRRDNLFDIGERAAQKQLKIVCDYLGIEGVSTHSFRKTFATNIYEDSGYNIELVRTLLQHSSTVTTQRYIGVGTKQVEEALAGISGKLLLG